MYKMTDDAAAKLAKLAATLREMDLTIEDAMSLMIAEEMVAFANENDVDKASVITRFFESEMEDQAERWEDICIRAGNHFN